MMKLMHLVSRTTIQMNEVVEIDFHPQPEAYLFNVVITHPIKVER